MTKSLGPLRLKQTLIRLVQNVVQMANQSVKYICMRNINLHVKSNCACGKHIPFIFLISISGSRRRCQQPPDEESAVGCMVTEISNSWELHNCSYSQTIEQNVDYQGI